MKKFLIVLSVLILTSIQANAAMKFSDAYAQSGTKPMLVLVYAKWADNWQGILQSYRNLQREYGTAFNYVELDIANPDTKDFNARYNITQNLPYVLMFRNSGKITRYIDNNCTSSYSCLSSKVKTFIK